MIVLGATYQTVNVDDPLLSPSPILSLVNVNIVTVALTDHPLIVDVGPQSTPPVTTPPLTTSPTTGGPVTMGTGPDRIVLNISEDAWQGDAQFVISVDGTQIGGSRTASASHAAGAERVYTVNGTFAAGTCTVTVNLLIDAYGGSPSRDRIFISTASSPMAPPWLPRPHCWTLARHPSRSGAPTSPPPPPPRLAAQQT